IPGHSQSFKNIYLVLINYILTRSGGITNYTIAHTGKLYGYVHGIIFKVILKFGLNQCLYFFRIVAYYIYLPKDWHFDIAIEVYSISCKVKHEVTGIHIGYPIL